MRKWLILLLLALAIPLAKAQPGTLGYTTQSGLITGANAYVANTVQTGTVPLTVTNCFIYVGASGTTGKQAECVITIMTTNANNFNGTPICHGTFVFPSGTLNAWETVPMPNCTLAANTIYFIGYDSNDSSMTFGYTANCNSTTCVGSIAAVLGGYGTAQNNANTCCTYPYGTTTFANYNNGGGAPAYGQSVYVTTVPTTTTVPGKLHKGTFQ